MAIDTPQTPLDLARAYLSAIGRNGGSSTTERKRAASRANGRMGRTKTKQSDTDEHQPINADCDIDVM